MNDKLTETIERLPDGKPVLFEVSSEMRHSRFISTYESICTTGELKAAFAELERLRAMVDEAGSFTIRGTSIYKLPDSPEWRCYDDDSETELVFSSVLEAYDWNAATNGVESL